MSEGRTSNDFVPRISTWPDGVLDVPPVQVRAVDECSDGFLSLSDRFEEREVPAELFMRELLDLDLEDDQALAEFTATFGLLAHPNWRRYVVPMLRDEEWEEQLGQEFIAHHPDVPAPQRGGAEGAPFRRVFHVEEIVAHALGIRAATRCWLAHMGGGDEGDVRTAWSVDEAFPSTGSMRTAWSRFSDVVNRGLRDRQVSVRVGTERDEPSMSLYPAVCLQLWNIVEEGAVPRRCANETCGRQFVRQREGAQHGQFRTKGVMYCSRSCAKAQAQREYRRRGTEEGTKR